MHINKKNKKKIHNHNQSKRLVMKFHQTLFSKEEKKVHWSHVVIFSNKVKFGLCPEGSSNFGQSLKVFLLQHDDA